MVRGPQKQCSHVSDMQIHNTNTQIHKYKNTNCWKYAFNTFWSKKNNLSSLFGLSNDLRVCSGYVGCTWWSPRTYWWRLLVIGDHISSKLFILHSSQQLGIQIPLIQGHSKTSKQRRAHPHKLICIQDLQHCHIRSFFACREGLKSTRSNKAHVTCPGKVAINAWIWCKSTMPEHWECSAAMNTADEVVDILILLFL